MKQKIVGNDVNADNKDLVIITGANQGGKLTFLRSIGLSQLMMQCGMMENVIFLRTERQTDGRRTFKLIEREPLQTSYGEDLYKRIFGTGNQIHYP